MRVLHSVIRSFNGWSENPISTTVDYRPITDIPFPLVTVCPPRNTYTSLNLALRTVENITLTSETREELTQWLPEIIFDSDFDYNFEKFSLATNLSRDWYSGDTQITFLLPSTVSEEEKDSLMAVMYSTSALAGTVSSPFFKQPFQGDAFERMLTFRIGFDKPKNATPTTKLELKLEFDTDKKRYWEEVVIGSGHYKLDGWFEDEKMEWIEEPTNFTQKVPLGTPMNERDPYVFVEFRRRMTAEDVSRWRTKRNTGIRLSWSYDDPELEPDHKYLEQNRDFIRLANILHSQNNKDQLWSEIKTQRNKHLEKIDEKEHCMGDNLFNDQLKQNLIADFFASSSVPGGVPDTPDYETDIAAETLAEAQKMFYYLTRCPNFYQTAPDLNNLFWSLLNSRFPLKTLLVTLTRMMVTTSEKMKVNELMATMKGGLNKFLKEVSYQLILFSYFSKNLICLMASYSWSIK